MKMLTSNTILSYVVSVQCVVTIIVFVVFVVVDAEVVVVASSSSSSSSSSLVLHPCAQVVAGQVAVSVPLQGPDYPLTREALESSYHHATTTSGLNVRALIVTNPHNPLGVVYSEEELLIALQWCREKKIHLISDEIYALSLFSPNGTTTITTTATTNSTTTSTTTTRSRFISMAALAQGDLGPLVHVLWGFSKDFGVSGFRCGVLYTQNPWLVKALDSISYFAGESSGERVLMPLLLRLLLFC